MWVVDPIGGCWFFYVGVCVWGRAANPRPRVCVCVCVCVESLPRQLFLGLPLLLWSTHTRISHANIQNVILLLTCVCVCVCVRAWPVVVLTLAMNMRLHINTHKHTL